VDEEFEHLLTAFSPARMEPYLKHCDGDVAKAFRLYTWNVEVSGALSGPLGCLEVVLRNALHNRLAAMTGRPDWWLDRRVDLHDVARGLLGEAAAKLARQGKSGQPDAMVAELHFGFWIALILDLIGYISPPAARYVGGHDRIERVLRRRGDVCDGGANPEF
jgi:hypothetical protein